MVRHTGRHFLQIPGPSHVPDRILRAIDRPTIDHRGPEFAELGKAVLSGIKTIFKTSGPVLIFPSSGTGAWEAAIANTLSPGDRVLMFETGQFAQSWLELARRFGLDVEFVPGDWRRGIDLDEAERRLRADGARRIKAVMAVHNETSTGVTSHISRLRPILTALDHPALLMVDAISSLGSIDLRHEDWGIDISIGGSQKGLMLPPGLGFNAVSARALDAARTARLPRSYWDWEAMLAFNADGVFPYTPATNLLYGLKEAIAMLHEEGLDHVFERHARYGRAARAAVEAWGLELQASDPGEFSSVLTAVRMPVGHDADRFRKIALDAFDISLGAGLGKLRGQVFRIGHLGHFNDLMLVGALAGVEMGLSLAGIPHRKGGVQAAMDCLSQI